MNRQRLILSLGMMAVAASISVPAEAAKKKFDLYSWPQGDTANFCYSILPASKDLQPADVIKASKDQVCGGRDDLKRIMGQAMPMGSKLTWKTDEANGFILPDRDIINDLERFSVTIPYKLVVVEPKK